jgi:hypothetical protein
MPVDETGGMIDSWTHKSKGLLNDLSDILANMSSGASSQGQGNGQLRALIGEFVGLMGPMIGEYRAERIIREF